MDKQSKKQQNPRRQPGGKFQIELLRFFGLDFIRSRYKETSKSLHRSLLSIVSILIILLQVPCLARPESGDEGVPKSKTVQLYFATTRLNKGNDVTPDYGGERHIEIGPSSMEYGIVGLHEPEGLKSPALAENGKEYKRLLRADADEWRKAQFTFVSKTNEEDFFKRIRDWNGPICVYMHGYDKPFLEAAEDAAMVFSDYQQYETSPQKKLLPLLFSWPSVGGRTEYGTDEANLEWSAPCFDYLLDRIIAEKKSTSPLDIVTHSMGGRLIYWYLNRQCSPRSQVFRNIFLCSGDLDFLSFESKKRIFEDSVSNKVYVFVSDRDKALILSHYLHEQPRLGRPIDPPKFTRERKTLFSSSYLAQLTTDTGDLLAGNDFTEPTDVKRWLSEDSSLDRELGDKARFIDVTDLITKDFGHGAAFSVIAAYMAGVPIKQLKEQVMHKRPARSILLQSDGKPRVLYRFLRLEPYSF